MSPAKIHGAEYSIGKVFSDDFVFTIPLYQRPYAWTTEQAGEMLEDLIAFLGDGYKSIENVNPYFLGSIVLIKGDSPEADVVDGQQRLTTLTILLAALRSLMQTEKAKHLTPFLYEIGNRFKGSKDNYRLTLRERDAEFFKKNIQKEGGINNLAELNSAVLSDSQKNIKENALLFIKRLQELPESKQDDLAEFIITQCFMVVVSTPDMDSAYRIFSVLNDRGLDLSYTDILKSEIIGKIPETAQQEAYTAKWEAIEERLGRETFKDLFAHIRMIYRKAKQSESILKEFRKEVLPAKTPQQFIDETLEPLADAFYDIKNLSYQSEKFAEKINGMFKCLNQIDNSDWMPPAIFYLSQNYNKPDLLVRFFNDLERLAAGLMIQRFNINKRIESYRRLLMAIEQGEDLYTSASPLQLTPEAQNNILQILNGDIYLVPKICSYTLLRLDAKLSEGEASYHFPNVTVEHVLPQSPAANSEWMQWFPTQEERQKYVHRLGNLVLLSRKKNSRAQNYHFDRKKQQYFTTQSGVSAFAITTQVLHEKEWTTAVIERRQKNLMDVLKNLWRL
ncbi:DUF262 domain-containing protein [Microcoleus sp. FACHB-68]|uniref:DUF262 domain-containing protein n=1 Tax=Microcoleus sp. FACHB-68 TaxID=2692826 RepID=UPI00168A0EEF|nr:DUF262 domain-containing protein [Microcoleus sp. FACHB-68]MBD1938305.1 DUF262 domain-containing protein [Microcoleus sp. FACHB-68]